MNYFQAKYESLLKGEIKVFGCSVDRYKSYELIFKILLDRKQKNFTIIETGCAFGGGWCHGNSSFLYFEFLNIFGGKLISIDISQEHMDRCKKIIDSVQPKTGRALFCPMVGDSLSILRFLSDKADLIYLDSWDLEREDPEPSMQHHLNEFVATKEIIRRSGSVIVAVDDNLLPLDIGKGKYIKEWAVATKQNILLDDYQLILDITDESVNR